MAATFRWHLCARRRHRLARDFYRSAKLPIAVIEAAAVAARAFAGRPNAEKWYAMAIAEADRAGEGLLAADLVIEHAVEFERASRNAEAAQVATDAASRCTLLGEAAAGTQALVHLLRARIDDTPKAALRHVEAAFEAALMRRDIAMLGEVLDVLVSGLAKARFPDDAWRVVAQFRDRLVQAELDLLANTAARALVELRG